MFADANLPDFRLLHRKDHSLLLPVTHPHLGEMLYVLHLVAITKNMEKYHSSDRFCIGIFFIARHLFEFVYLLQHVR